MKYFKEIAELAKSLTTNYRLQSFPAVNNLNKYLLNIFILLVLSSFLSLYFQIQIFTKHFQSLENKQNKCKKRREFLII